MKIQFGKQNSVDGRVSFALTTRSALVFAEVNDSNCTTHAQIGNVTNSSFSCRASQYGTWGEGRNMFWIALGY